MADHKKTFQCCEKPDYIGAYIGHWDFGNHICIKGIKAKYCLSCGQVTEDTSWWSAMIFNTLAWLIWDGTIIVDYDEGL